MIFLDRVDRGELGGVELRDFVIILIGKGVILIDLKGNFSAFFGGGDDVKFFGAH